MVPEKIIRIMMAVLPRCLCRGLFRKLVILTFPCLCTFSLMLFVLNNFNNFHTKSNVHEIHTRYKNQLQRPGLIFLVTKVEHTILGYGYSVVYCLQFLI